MLRGSLKSPSSVEKSPGKKFHGIQYSHIKNIVGVLTYALSIYFCYAAVSELDSIKESGMDLDYHYPDLVGKLRIFAFIKLAFIAIRTILGIQQPGMMIHALINVLVLFLLYSALQLKSLEFVLNRAAGLFQTQFPSGQVKEFIRKLLWADMFITFVGLINFAVYSFPGFVNTTINFLILLSSFGIGLGSSPPPPS